MTLILVAVVAFYVAGFTIVLLSLLRAAAEGDW